MSLFRPQLVDFISPANQNNAPFWPYYDSSYTNQQYLGANAFCRHLQIGHQWSLKGEIGEGGGNSFMAVKATVALAAGQLVAEAAPATDTCAAGCTSQVIKLTTGGLTAQAEVGNIVYVAPANGTDFTPFMRQIVANTANTLTIDTGDATVAGNPAGRNAYTGTLPAAADLVIIYRPWQVRVCTATLTPIGIALGTVTQNYYTIIQRSGLGLILTTGSGVATVVGRQSAPGAAGVVTGFAGTATALTGAAAPLYGVGARMISLQAWAGSSMLTPHDTYFD